MLSPLISVSIGAFMTGMYVGFLHYPLKMYIDSIYRSAKINGLLTLSSIPGELKFLWIHYLENLNLPFIKCGIKKKLLIILDFFITLVTFGFYYFAITNITYYIVYLGIFAVFISLRDSVSVGYKMEFYPKDKLGEVTGVISGAYNVGLYIGGGLLTLFVVNWGVGVFQFAAISWLDVFLYSSIFFALNTVLDCFMMNSKEYEVEPIKFESNMVKYLVIATCLALLFYICNVLLIPIKYTMIVFFAVALVLFYFTILQNSLAQKIYSELLVLDKRQLFYLLGFLLTYKLSPRLIMSVTIPLFRKFQMDMFTFKTISSVVILLNVIFVPFCLKYFGPKKLRMFSLLVYLIPVVLFCVCFYCQLYSYLFYVSVLERIARGFAEDVFFLAKTSVCGKKHAMSQLTILSCLEKIFSNIISIGSGYLVEYVSWAALFWLALLSIVPSLFFAFNLEKVNIE